MAPHLVTRSASQFSIFDETSNDFEGKTGSILAISSIGRFRLYAEEIKMRYRNITIGMLLCGLSLASCGEVPKESVAAASEDKADGFTDAAILRFNKDLTVEVQGTLAPGGRVRVQYDLERLTDCRASSNGYDAWGITGYFSVDGGQPKTFDVTTTEDRRRVAREAIINLPSGGDLAFWFVNTDRYGCVAYDSDFGNNFHFPLDASAQGATAVLTFAKDGAPTLEGAIVRGGKLRIVYDTDRITQCRGETSGYPAWAISLHYSIDGVEAPQEEMTHLVDHDLVLKEVVLTGLQGSELSLWFVNTNRWGCIAYDSNQSDNYRFEIGSN
jgi:hypothetical protein